MTMKKPRLAFVGVGLCVGFCIAALLCTGCQSRQLFVHGSSGIMSRDTRLKTEHLEVGKSTEREVVEILGEPSNRLLSDGGGRALNYNCVATVMRTRYLFSPKLNLTTSQDTFVYSCLVSLSPDGKLKKIDFQEEGSNKVAAH